MAYGTEQGHDPDDSLEVRYDGDADGTGKLCVRAAAGGYSGRSEAWFGHGYLVEFFTALAGFPITEDTPCRSRAALDTERARGLFVVTTGPT
jgi:hypothetical protein